MSTDPRSDLTPKEQAEAEKQLRRTFKHPESDGPGLIHIGADLVRYIPKHERVQPVRQLSGYEDALDLPDVREARKNPKRKGEMDAD